MAKLNSIYRTHTCAELRLAHVGQSVKLSGWLHRMRDHGGLVFVDLRDHYGITQVVFSDALLKQIQELRVESVLMVSGKVVKRAAETINTRIETGEVEVRIEQLEVLSSADVLPFQIAEDDNAPETTRLKYRFMELRREKLHNNIVLRCRVIQSIREIMTKLGFLEFQTPILTSSSPEGARDFIVPSRLHPGKFFALPQAPQQFKQLLMVSGFDRYFQIAPCFRDEDARADRSPGEFYQIDMEMSFVEQEDVFEVVEELFCQLFSSYSKKPMQSKPFPRLKYDDCIEKYGNDKPDLRIALQIENLSDVFSSTQFRVFKSALDSGGRVAAIKLDLDALPPRKYFDDTIEWFSKLGGGGLAYISVEGAEHKGSIAKFLQSAEIEQLKAKATPSKTSIFFFAAGAKKQIMPWLGKLRLKLAEDYKLVENSAWKFCWITDYPMYEQNEETGQIEFGHNPFSMPQGGLKALNEKPPLEIYAHQYDLVCNGYEILSGAIRNHEPEIMYKAFEIAGHSRADVDEKFGGMIRAFRFGAPPHGGCAPGIERIVMLLAEETAIREVISFPLTQNAEDLLMGAPSRVSEKQLREVHIQLAPSAFKDKE